MKYARRYTIHMSVNGKDVYMLVSKNRGILIDRGLKNVTVKESITYDLDDSSKVDLDVYDSIRMGFDDINDIVLSYNRRSLEYSLIPRDSDIRPLLLGLHVDKIGA